MRDCLLDLVGHTLDLGCIDLIKIVGTADKTSVVGLATDLSVVLDARFHTPVAEFVGTFGMPNLAKLKILLNLPEYKENAKLAIKKQASGDLEGIDFENAAGDFRNSYRFMASQIITDKLKTPKFNGVNWHIEFEPAAAAILRLRMQAQANSEQANFQVKTDNGDLKFFFGDHSTHAGNFVFHSGVKNSLKRPLSWPAVQVMSILALSGNKIMRISDDGAMQITVDSGIAVYDYTLPAQSK
jgi:hypothetical protein